MKLEEIGFYTLSDSRASKASVDSPLWRCEILLTDRCNFTCPYCRGSNQWTKGTLTLDEAKHVVDMWASHNLKNIRFSGGEPTLLEYLPELVRHTRDAGVERIAISTNGSASWNFYQRLIDCGVNDFSVSLDACCASTGNSMAGKRGVWDILVSNIRKLAEQSYTTVGVVLTDDNFQELSDIIRFATSLGVSDIRIISSAQWNNEEKFRNLFDDQEILTNFPILKYRIDNFRNGRNVRGISNTGSHRCYMALDDMVIAGKYHFPCVIAMREGVEPIGTITGKTMTEIRYEREKWLLSHDTYKDPVCSKNCLDVCCDYNTKCMNSMRRGALNGIGAVC